MAFSGADRDEVATPGLELPVQQAELWNPSTGDWRPVASGHRPRTYHNSAALLPDGRILIGGHAPITTLYLNHISVPGFSPNERDPSFELYSPPYLFRGARPQITSAPVDARLRRHDADHRRPAGERDRQRRAGPQPDARRTSSTPTSATSCCAWSPGSATG